MTFATHAAAGTAMGTSADLQLTEDHIDKAVEALQKAVQQPALIAIQRRAWCRDDGRRINEKRRF